MIFNKEKLLNKDKEHQKVAHSFNNDSFKKSLLNTIISNGSFKEPLLNSVLFFLLHLATVHLC
jgi:hypothetical protein